MNLVTLALAKKASGGSGGGGLGGTYTMAAGNMTYSTPTVGSEVHHRGNSMPNTLWTAFPDETGAERIASGTIQGGRSGMVAQANGTRITVTGAYMVSIGTDDDDRDVYEEVTDLNYDAAAGTYTYDGKTYRVRSVQEEALGPVTWLCYELAPLRGFLEFSVTLSM